MSKWTIEVPHLSTSEFADKIDRRSVTSWGAGTVAAASMEIDEDTVYLAMYTLLNVRHNHT